MRSDADAVSSVVGTVLMLGITVTVFAGFSFFVLDYLQSTPPAPRADIAAVQQGPSYLLVNRGGESVPLAEGSLLLNVAGSQQRLALSSFAASGYLGAGATQWGIGQTVCIAGAGSAGRTCLYDTATVPFPDIRGSAVVASNAFVANDGVLAGGSPVGFTPTYITSGGIAATAGTLTNAAGATAVGGTEASLVEVPVTFAIQAGTTTTGSSGISETSCASFANEQCALASDDQFAVLDNTADILDVNGVWTTPPAGAGGITQVLVGFEARKGGATSPVLTLSYKVSGVAGPTTLTGQTLASTSSDTTTTLDITGDRSWSTADIQALTIQLVATTVGNNANVDQLFVKVSYAVAGGAGRGMNQILTWASVPAATASGVQTLEVGYHITPTSSNDVFAVQIFTPATSAWRTCSG